jgi:DNA-binding LacI/PurR family transcriptional regulator
MARAAIDYLVALADGGDTPPSRIELPLSLVVRESTAPPA